MWIALLNMRKDVRGWSNAKEKFPYLLETRMLKGNIEGQTATYMEENVV